MNKFSAGIALVMILGFAAPIQAETDKDGSSDHPLISRYPGFYIDEYKLRDFDRAQMISSAMDDSNYELMDVEGQVSNIEYRIRDETISGFQLFANYEKALSDLDAEIIFSCFGQEDCGGTGTEFYNESVGYTGLFGGDRIDFYNEFGIITALVKQEGQQAHVMVVTAADKNDRRRVHQTIVTTASLDTDKIGIGTIEDVTAAVSEAGAVVLDGIFFDTGTASLSAESNETLDTTAAYLAANLDQQFYIVGHTDWAGSYDLNISLSNDRAQSVVDALVERGIARDRLTGVGVGPVAPNATNESDDGRKLNRRVELVLSE